MTIFFSLGTDFPFFPFLHSHRETHAHSLPVAHSLTSLLTLPLDLSPLHSLSSPPALSIQQSWATSFSKTPPRALSPTTSSPPAQSTTCSTPWKTSSSVWHSSRSYATPPKQRTQTPPASAPASTWPHSSSCSAGPSAGSPTPQKPPPRPGSLRRQILALVLLQG